MRFNGFWNFILCFVFLFLYKFLFRSANITHSSEGFYRAKYARGTGNHSVCLALLVDPDSGIPLIDSRSLKRYNVEFQTHRPHTGTKTTSDKYEEVLKQGDKITPDQAEKLWKYHHDSSTRHCIHMFWDGRCKNLTVGNDCDVSKMIHLTLFVLVSFLFLFFIKFVIVCCYEID